MTFYCMLITIVDLFSSHRVILLYCPTLYDSFYKSHFLIGYFKDLDVIVKLKAPVGKVVYNTIDYYGTFKKGNSFRSNDV